MLQETINIVSLITIILLVENIKKKCMRTFFKLHQCLNKKKHPHSLQDFDSIAMHVLPAKALCVIPK